MTFDPETREVIRKVRDEVLTDPDRWTTHKNAADIDGDEVDADSPAAVCWCIDGAILKVCGGSGRLAGRAYQLLSRFNSGITLLVEWNDEPERTFQDVRDLLDRALSEGSVE